MLQKVTVAARSHQPSTLVAVPLALAFAESSLLEAAHWC